MIEFWKMLFYAGIVGGVAFSYYFMVEIIPEARRNFGEIPRYFKSPAWHETRSETKRILKRWKLLPIVVLSMFLLSGFVPSVSANADYTIYSETLLKPDATLANEGFTITGAATIHAALQSDDSDTSYINASAAWISTYVSLDTFTDPGVTNESFRIIFFTKVKTAYAAPIGQMVMGIATTSSFYQSSNIHRYKSGIPTSYTNYSVVTTISPNTGLNWTVAEINAAYFQLCNGGNYFARFTYAGAIVQTIIPVTFTETEIDWNYIVFGLIIVAFIVFFVIIVPWGHKNG